MELNRGVKRKLNFKIQLSRKYTNTGIWMHLMVYKREQEREMSYYKHPTFISKEQQKTLQIIKLEQRSNQRLNRMTKRD